MLLVALVLVVLFVVVSEPAGTAAGSGGPDTAPPRVDVGQGMSEPPSDLGEDEVWLADVTLDAGSLLTEDQELREVTAVGHGVRTGPDGLVADEVAVQATVPFDVVAAELGEGVTVRAGDAGRATVVRTAQALGRELQVVATGTVEVVAGRLVLEPTSIDVGGPAFLGDAIAAVVRGLVTIEHEIEGLPDGLVLREVVVQSDGFRASLDGTDVSLVP